MLMLTLNSIRIM